MLPLRARRVLRSLRQAIPSSVVLGRRSSGEGPVEFIPLAEITKAQLDAISATQGSILYRGASEWTALAPGANGEVLTSGGGGANPTWEPASASSGAWWFAPPVATNFSATSEGSPSSVSFADDSDVGLTIAATIPTDDHAYMILKSAPSQPFTITARVLVGRGFSADPPLGGIVIRESGGGKRVSFTSDSDQNIIVRTATGTTFTGNYNQGPRFSAYDGLWLRMTVNASDEVTCYYSADGKQFHEWASLTAAQALNTTCDEVGFILTKRSGGSAEMSMSVGHYAET